jgi:hypothetical protein
VIPGRRLALPGGIVAIWPDEEDAPEPDELERRRQQTAKARATWERMRAAGAKARGGRHKWKAVH